MRLVLLILCAVLATAQEDHSQHQHAVAGLGTVDFPTSCNATAQKLISRGAALLHSFGYEEARITFNDAAKADPACAMAYWGVARTWYHPIWAPPSPDELKQGAAALDRALAIDAKTDRERDYINALAVFYKDWQTVDHVTRAKNYERALAEVCDRNPSDDEAAIFHALQLVAIGYLDPTDKTYTWQKKGSEILNQVLVRHPNHPGVAHYIIHSVDYPSLAELGLQAARVCQDCARFAACIAHAVSYLHTAGAVGRFHSLEHRLDEVSHRTGATSARRRGSIRPAPRDGLPRLCLSPASEGHERSKGAGGDGGHHQARRKSVRRRLRLCGLASALGS